MEKQVAAPPVFPFPGNLPRDAGFDQSAPYHIRLSHSSHYVKSVTYGEPVRSLPLNLESG